jgi:PhzF family phenazine biosynthesis protein
MELRIFQVDAFSEAPFSGNPAAVCPLDEWLDEVTLQAIAAENNLSETAFFVPRGDTHELRWFTPTVEVDLCGHATLAAAWVLINELGTSSPLLRFSTRSGELRVSREGNLLAMDFPAKQPLPCDPPAALLPALGIDAAEVFETDDFIVVVDNESIVERIAPDFAALKGLPKRGVAVTAAGASFDFVSRWFGPNVGVDEDPVTGSAHTSLAPLWAQRLQNSKLRAQQGGRRKGQLSCEVVGERVVIRGHGALYMKGTLALAMAR